MTTEPHADVDYRKYWIAWFVLLIITLAMIFVGSPTVLILGMTCKATIICLWFMHLRYEHIELVLSVLIGIFGTSLILYLLIAPDGMAM